MIIYYWDKQNISTALNNNWIIDLLIYNPNTKKYTYTDDPEVFVEDSPSPLSIPDDSDCIQLFQIND